MILVLAGAGASCALDPEQYPTTEAFFQRLPDKVRRKNKLFAQVCAFLNEGASATKIIDIELVLASLQDLKDTAGAIGARDRLPGWLLRPEQIGKVVQKAQMGGALQVIDDVSEQADALMSQINRQVYDLYHALPAAEQVERTWFPLLRGLLKRDERVEVFTTNYDRVIEHALDTGALPIDTGRTKGVSPTLDVSLWDLSQPPRQSLARGLLTKLHGSVDWFREPSGGPIYTGTPMFGGSHESHVIIYPGFKNGELPAPLDAFQQHLQTCVAEASALIIIGYAFRDPHINAALRQRTRQDATVVVINPQERFDETPIHAKVVRHIKQGFDETSVRDTLEQIRTAASTSAPSRDPV